MRRVLAFIAFIVACPSSLAAQSGSVPFSAVADSAKLMPAAELRIAYGAATSQFIEVRLPSAPGPHPTVFLLHGGCWLRAYGVDHVAGIAESLRAAGFAVFAPEYRRVGEDGAGVPGTLDDVRAAYDSLRAVAPRLGLDTNRVVAMGHSAGGQLALWLASEPGVRLRGVIALAAVTDLAAFAAPTGCGAAVPRLMGGAPDGADRVEPNAVRAELAGRYAAVSPISRVGPPADTRVVLVTAADDRVVPFAQAAVYLTRFPGTRHAPVPGGHFDVVAPWTPAWAQIVAMLQPQGDHPLPENP